MNRQTKIDVLQELKDRVRDKLIYELCLESIFKPEQREAIRDVIKTQINIRIDQLKAGDD